LPVTNLCRRRAAVKKRWGVRVIAILMLIAGLLLFLLGILPAIRVALRGTGGGLGAYLAIPSALGGCAGALFLLVVGSVLLTLGKISENFAAVSQPASDRRAAPAAAVVTGTSVAVADERGSGAAVAATVAAMPEAEAVPAPAVEVQSAEPVAAAAIAGAVVTEEQPGGEAEIAPLGASVVATAIAGAAFAEEPPGGEEELTPADEIVEEAAAPAAVAMAVAEKAPPEAIPQEPEVSAGGELAAREEAATPAETVVEAPAAMIAAEVLEPQAAEPKSPQDEVRALQAQLAALQAQLDELEGASPGSEELPATVDDEGPAPGATESVKLPGADDAARVAAEMAALDMEPHAEAS
jgi:hypothetical protein